MKITFKKTPYQHFQSRSTDIKSQKKKIGYIQESRDFDCWKIYFTVKKEVTKEEPSDFKWILLTKRFTTEDKAREYIKENTEQIFKQFDIYQFED